MPGPCREIDENRMAGLLSMTLFAARKTAIYPTSKSSNGLRPIPGVHAMTRFLFLKSDRIGHKNGSRRGVSNAGIDVRLLSLLSARYV